MNTKILRYELLSFFLLTLICSVVYIYGEQMPDHYLEITSADPSSNFFTYYFSSFLQFVYYYTGLWVLFPFVCLLILYVPVLSKRGDVFDMLTFVASSVASLTFSLLVFPNFVGSGLRQFANFYFSGWSFGFFFVLSTFAMMWMIFRNDFIEKLKDASDSVREKLSNNEALNKVKSEAIKANEGMFEKLKGFVAKNANAEKLQSLLRIEHKPVEKTAAEEKPEIKAAPVVTKKEEPALIAAVNKQEEKDESSQYLPVSFESLKEDVQEIEQKTKVLMEEEKPLASSEVVESIPVNRAPLHDENLYYSIVNQTSERKTEVKISHPEEKYFVEILDTIESKLKDFGIEGRIINILKGPVVDTFELLLGPTTRVSKVTSINDDLSLALKGQSIRIVHPMPGRTTIGIEVPRNPREFIFLEEMLGSDVFQKTKASLPLAMGKNAYGEPVVSDLATMPHLLVAGSTGAGKSVFINSVLVSLLVKRSPNQMKLILIDPKQLELALYAKLPHLCMPVITQPKQACIALLWACEEMERRYSILSEFGVRNIAGFNEKLKTATPELKAKLRKHYEYATEDTYELPYLVIIVDEFADLMLSSAGKDIETNIARLAAKARAAGIHLILATQRPSVDVITGVIKGNFPVRVSFKVTSGIDSRTILNEQGAEKLLGKGDMLLKQNIDTVRLHSSFIQEEAIEELTEKLADMPTTFDRHAMEFLENGGEDPEAAEIARASQESLNGGKDERYDEAVRVVIEHRQASASLLQRRLGVGYNRAANLIEEMEANGVVGPAQGSKPRKVLVGGDTLSP